MSPRPPAVDTVSLFNSGETVSGRGVPRGKLSSVLRQTNKSGVCRLSRVAVTRGGSLAGHWRPRSEAGPQRGRSCGEPGFGTWAGLSSSWFRGRRVSTRHDWKWGESASSACQTLEGPAL